MKENPIVLMQTIYKNGSYGNYKMWGYADGTPSHFGWEVPANLDELEGNEYTVYYRKDYLSDREMLEHMIRLARS